MKKIIFLSLLLLLGAMVPCCGAQERPADFYKLKMQQLIGNLRVTAKAVKPEFGLIGNGGVNIYRPMEYHEDGLNRAAQAVGLVDGILLESLNYGYDYDDGGRTPDDAREYFLKCLELPRKMGTTIFNIDYCKGLRQKTQARLLSQEEGIINYCAPRELDVLPAVEESDNKVETLKDCQSFGIILNPHRFKSKEAYLKQLQSSGYDLLIIDAQYGDSFLTAAEVNSLKYKANGQRRLVYSYLSIGEAEEYRYYWKQEYFKQQPAWLAGSNENWEGNYKVKYWQEGWQKILFKNNDSYLKQIVQSDFDGAFLDIVDAFEYFEDLEE